MTVYSFASLCRSYLWARLDLYAPKELAKGPRPVLVMIYGGDPERLFVMGHSAGAHLAALVAVDETKLAAHEKPLSMLAWSFAVFRLPDATAGGSRRLLRDPG